MRKLFSTLLLLLLAGPAFALESQQNSINYTTDTYVEALQALDDEVDVLYGHINNLFKLQASATAPAVGTRDQYDLWFDTGNTSLKYWDGAAYQTLVSPTAWNSGVALNDGMRGYSKNMYLVRYDADDLRIVGTTSAPATVVVVDGEGDILLLQNTTNTTTTGLFTGASSGNYDIAAEQDGTGTTFTLARAAAGAYSGGGRVIGQVGYSGSDFTWIKNYEVSEPLKHSFPEGLFHAYLTTEQSLDGDPTASCELVELTNEVIDQNGWFDATTNYTLTPTWNVWMEIHAHAVFSDIADGNSVSVRIIRRYGANPEDIEVHENRVYSSGASSVLSVGVTAITKVLTTDTIEMWACTNDGNTDLTDIQGFVSGGFNVSQQTATAMWGRVIGRVY